MSRQADIETKKRRLELYYKKETEILDGGVKAYGIGSRNVQRYDAALSEVRTAIAQLEAEIKSLEAVKPRKAVGIVPRDW